MKSFNKLFGVETLYLKHIKYASLTSLSSHLNGALNHDSWAQYEEIRKLETDDQILFLLYDVESKLIKHTAIIYFDSVGNIMFSNVQKYEEI